ncbi:MAG: DUF3500 domain-containing protein [Longimicrobiales bacterium]
MRRPIVYAVIAATGIGLGAVFLESSRSARATADIVAAGEAFLATLDNDQRTRAARLFDDSARFDWFFTPVARTGLPLEDMTLEQRRAALHLLQSATSSQGYLKATGVMHLEGILAVLENRPDRRDPENYHFWIFGTPSADQPWGWRFEGHHVSLNFTSADGITVSTPAFIGANPALVTSGPFAGWRLLANEEDKARALVLSLDPRQRARAIISETAPQDIITGNDRRARVERLEGLPAGEMTQAQRTLLMSLVSEYLDNMDPAIAAPRYARIEETGVDRLHFAWAGALEAGGPHYYRIHGPTVLIEYDNTQNDANHIHSVWRDLENDFGEDLLRRHYETAVPDHGHDHAGGQAHAK